MPNPDRPNVLLTGFGPFPTVPANATTLLVPRIAEAARRTLPGVAVWDRILPTEWHASRRDLDDMIVELRPVVAVHFGVSSRATGFEIETRGRNFCASSKDAAGCLPLDQCVTRGGPEHLAATWPAPLIVERLRRRGLPARISRDAGGYLCNALLYRSLEAQRTCGAPGRVGFVHLPSSLASERMPHKEPTAQRHGLTWLDVVTGGVEIVSAALGRPAPSLARLLPVARGTDPLLERL